MVPNPDRFPNGINGVADQIHALGLKLDKWAQVISRSDAGTNTCAGYPGSLGYEEIDAATFNEWGIDYLKYGLLVSKDGVGHLTDLSKLSSDQLAIIKNTELLAFNQDPIIGTAAVPFKATSSAPTTSPPEYYSGASSKGTHVFIINISASVATKTFSFSNVPGLGTSGNWKIHDMWTGTDLPGTYAVNDTFSVSVAPHDTVAYLLIQA
ncbi:hypothetical protein H0H81_006688 [Sphagnurus paluster]|uniref:alpha-galactosidase n=1 Tax=Sphagnurus paluster TaxID=117069 RepID=A0A9P7FVH0_9AGAR|nr:hypothetical protein H0H81_006688 [Sphagnurus paluster]